MCNNLKGYLLEKGSGVYEIFSSRGSIENELEMLRETMLKMGEAVSFDVSVRAEWVLVRQFPMLNIMHTGPFAILTRRQGRTDNHT